MKTYAFGVLAVAILAGTKHLSPRDLLKLPRPLTGSEIAIVLTATQEALSGKTFRLSSIEGRRGAGPEVRMKDGGHPTIIPLESSVSSAPLLIGAPTPNVVVEPMPRRLVQTLWIDVRSLRPLRWEVWTGDSRTDGYEFEYRRIDLRTPASVQAPKCIS